MRRRQGIRRGTIHSKKSRCIDRFMLQEKVEPDYIFASRSKALSECLASRGAIPKGKRKEGGPEQIVATLAKEEEREKETRCFFCCSAAPFICSMRREESGSFDPTIPARRVCVRTTKVLATAVDFFTSTSCNVGILSWSINCHFARRMGGIGGRAIPKGACETFSLLGPPPPFAPLLLFQLASWDPGQIVKKPRNDHFCLPPPQTSHGGLGGVMPSKMG